MEKLPGTAPDDPKDSADDLDNINEEGVDHSQSAPSDGDNTSDGPSTTDAFRAGM